MLCMPHQVACHLGRQRVATTEIEESTLRVRQNQFNGNTTSGIAPAWIAVVSRVVVSERQSLGRVA